MTLDECTAWLVPLALAMRTDFDEPTYKGYAALLADVPLELADEAFKQCVAREPRFFPTAPEIQSAAERVRRQLLALVPWTPCVRCRDENPGWLTVFDGDTPRLKPCPCKRDHQQMLESRGLLEPIVPLPHEAGAGDARVYPTIDQLPAGIRKRLKGVAAQKVLR